MKLFNKFSIVLMIMLLFVSMTYAGIITDVDRQKLPQGQTFYTYASMDSAEIDTSRTFSFCFYDAKKSTGSTIMPIPFAYLNSSIGTPKITIVIDGSMDATNWIVIDTVSSSATAKTLTYGTVDLDNKYYPYNRLRLKSEATGAAATVKLWFYMYWEREDK